MGKWVLYTQPNYAHPKPTQTSPFDTPNFDQILNFRDILVIF